MKTDDYFAIGTVLTIVGILLACAASVQTNTTVQDQTEDFEPFPDGSTVAVLPVTGGSPAAQEGISTAVDSILRDQSEFEVLSVTSVQTTLNDSGLVEDYQKAIRGYQETSMMNQQTLSRILNALDADYLFQASAGQFQNQEQTEIGAVSGNLESMENKETRVYGRVWAKNRAQPAWSAYTQSAAEETDLTYIKANQAEFYYHAAVGLTNRLFSEETEQDQ